MTTYPYRKKLIEVALPLEAINVASAREKSIRHGHPSTLHLWWARRPLAACRAVLFASLVDDPDSDPAYAHYDADTREHMAGEKRQQLFDLITELVQWENSNDELVINAARAEIARCVASRKIELGELKKDFKLPGGETVYDLVVKGHGDLPRLREGKVRLPNRESVNFFLATYAPPVLDPFAGGGSIPLEAQRLGLRAYASDLNPVPVLINKALIEIPPKFANRPPVNPDAKGDAGPAGKKGKGKGKSVFEKSEWRGAQGLADDVRYYGQWMRDRAEERIGHLYPKIDVTADMANDRPDLKPYVGESLTVIAWLWARTVASPNPAVAGAHVPLVRSFWLSTKKGKEAWVRPVIDRKTNTYRFEVRTGTPDDKATVDAGTKIGRGCKFKCLLSDQPIPDTHVKEAGRADELGSRLLAVVAEGTRGRVYLSPDEFQEHAARVPKPGNMSAIEAPLANDPRNLWCLAYGLDRFDKLFTPRQLTALVTFSDLVGEARAKVLADAQTCWSEGRSSGNARVATENTGGHNESASSHNENAREQTANARAEAGNTPLARSDNPAEAPDHDPRGIDAGGSGPQAYADAVATYLAFGVDRQANYSTSLNTWADFIVQTFGRQALPMVWDYCEGNPLSDSTGNWDGAITWIATCIERSPANALPANVKQLDAIAPLNDIKFPVVSTDPPYYDNIGYADLSDFFYVWLRRSLSSIFPQLFSTLLTPKSTELIASPYRHEGSKAKAKSFFELGLGKAFERMHAVHESDYPLTIYYGFKQSETEDSDGDADSQGSTASTGWETMLEGVKHSGFSIVGTWPVRTERDQGLKTGDNVLASSIVLVCRPCPSDAPLATRREFLNALKRELPDALKHLQRGNIAPVDLAQASIGPGMAVFTRYAKVMEADGTSMKVRQALALINQTLDEVLAEQEGEFDADTRWAVAWFEQFAMEEGAFGTAETLSKAKNTAVNGLVEAGIIKARSGKVRLVKRDELPADWNPATDDKVRHWEVAQHLIHALETGGETAAADLLRKVGGLGEVARDLAYRLYNLCERKKWASEALAYNGLVIAWPEISKLAQGQKAVAKQSQEEMF